MPESNLLGKKGSWNCQ